MNAEAFFCRDRDGMGLYFTGKWQGMGTNYKVYRNGWEMVMLYY